MEATAGDAAGDTAACDDVTAGDTAAVAGDAATGAGSDIAASDAAAAYAASDAATVGDHDENEGGRGSNGSRDGGGHIGDEDDDSLN